MQHIVEETQFPGFNLYDMNKSDCSLHKITILHSIRFRTVSASQAMNEVVNDSQTTTKELGSQVIAQTHWHATQL